MQHTEYNLHTCPTLENSDLSISRVVVYTHQSLVVRRRYDLEENTISAIWLELGLPHKKKIIVCNAYREWQQLGQLNSESGTVAAQLQRWCKFLDMWEMALKEGKEVVVMMDANLDFLKWTRSDLPANDITRRLSSLIEQLFTRIFPHGVSQLVTTATRSWPGQADSGLDHIYSNKPDKLSSVHAEFTGNSDHKIIKVTRFAKSLSRNARYVRKRSFKNFCVEDFCMAVKQLSWFDLFLCDDVHQATDLLTTKLNTILDAMAPVKTFQVRAKYAPWLSDETKQLIKKRKEAQVLASQSQSQDDWRGYKNLRNTTTARIRKEKKTWEKMKLDHTKEDPSSVWKTVKSWLSWNKSGPPTQLFHEGRIVNSPDGLSCQLP